MKKKIGLLFCTVLALLALYGCGQSESTEEKTVFTAVTDDTAVITLSEDGAQVSGTGAEVSEGRVEIRAAGTYTLRGNMDDGQVYVNVAAGDVTLVLDGVSLTNSADACVYVESADNVYLSLAAGTENTFVSGTQTEIVPAQTEADTVTTSADTDASAEQADTASGAAVYSAVDLFISGDGGLVVDGYLNNGIQTKDDLTIEGGTISVRAVNNGVKGKDSVTVSGGTLSVNAGNDAIKADNTSGGEKGNVTISGGNLTLVALGDGVSAENTLTVTGGVIDVTTGDLHEAQSMTQWAEGKGFRTGTEQLPPETGAGTDTETSATVIPGRENDMGNAWSDSLAEDMTVSCKGLKAGTALIISGGEINVTATDHALHATGTIDITGGGLTLASTAGKGISGHGNVTIASDDTQITITKSTEGIESKAVLTVNGGTLDITASDDGFNAGGSNGFSFTQTDSAQTDTTHSLIINGGTIHVNAAGDGLDSNGDLIVNGGDISVDGPTSGMDGAIDSGAESGGVCAVNGGTVVALGSSGMAENFDASSTQCAFLFSFPSTVTAGTQITVTDSAGTQLLSYTAQKDAQCMVFSSPALAVGETYTVQYGETSGSIEQTQTVTGQTAGMGRGGMTANGDFAHGGGNRGDMIPPTDAGTPQPAGGNTMA